MLTTPFVLIQSSNSAEWHRRSKCWILTLFCGTDASYINERSRLICGKHWRVVGIMVATTDWTVLRYASQISSQNPSTGYHRAIFSISVFLGGLWIQQNQHFFCCISEPSTGRSVEQILPDLEVHSKKCFESYMGLRIDPLWDKQDGSITSGLSCENEVTEELGRWPLHPPFASGQLAHRVQLLMDSFILPC